MMCQFDASAELAIAHLLFFFFIIIIYFFIFTEWQFQHMEANNSKMLFF